MNASILSVAAGAATLLGTAAAQTQEARSAYLEVGLGIASPTRDDVSIDFGGGFIDDFEAGLDTGAQFHLLGGYEVMPNLALELELRGQGHTDEFSGSNDDSTVVGAYLVNAVYKGDERAAFVPYAGVGIGYADLDFVVGGEVLEDDFDGALAYQLKAGVARPVGLHHSFALEAGYLGTGGFEADRGGETVTFDYGGFSVGVNYRFRFDPR